MLSRAALAGMLHRALALGTRCVEVVVSDMRVTYGQQDEPGPYPGLGGPLEGRDAVRLGIRQLLILPRGAPSPVRQLCARLQYMCVAVDAVLQNHASWKPLMPLTKCVFCTSASAAEPSGVTESAPANTPQASEGERAVGWLEAARLSGQALGRSIAASAPFSVSAQVTGVSLALLAYDARQPAQAVAAAARPAAAGPSSSTAGGAPVPPIVGFRRAPGAVPRAEQPLRLRKRVRMAAAGARRGAHQAQNHSAAGAGPAAPPADPGPVAEHTLLQQWGMSLHVRVVPPLWSERQQPAADDTRDLHNHHSHPGAEKLPLHVPEEASTPSTSDTGADAAAALRVCTARGNLDAFNTVPLFQDVLDNHGWCL